MSDNHHTPIAYGADANDTTFNAPLGQLDQTLTDMLDGTEVFTGLVVGSAGLDTSAIAEIDSTTKGFLPPRMTSTQRDAIASPAEGLLVHNTTAGVLSRFNGSSWGNYGGGISPFVEIVPPTAFNTGSLLIDNIDQGYHDLILRLSIVMSGASPRVLNVRPNDVSTGYAWAQTRLGAAAMQHNSDDSDSAIDINEIIATGATSKSEILIRFHNYAVAGIKLFGSWIGTVSITGSRCFGRGAFEDRNLAAIESIRLLPASAGAETIIGSYALYGMGTPE